MLKTQELRGFWEDGQVGSTRTPSSTQTITLTESVQGIYIGTPWYTEGLKLPGRGLDSK